MRSVFALLLALLPALALADTPQMYKWTDADGVIHFSDQPPKQPQADLQTLDVPQFPAVDPEKLVAEQAAQAAQLKSLRELLAAEDLEQERAALARQAAALQAQLDAMQQPEVEPEPLLYSTSVLVPRAFRGNLFRFHHPDHDPGHHVRLPLPPGSSMPVRP